MPVPEQRATVARHLLRDNAYTALCEAIVGGTLAPGERLHDHELCVWLGLSRTPVREALSRLEDEGLVETAPQRYTRVSPLDRRDVQELFPLMAAIHALATGLGVPRMIAEDVKALNASNEAFVRALRAGDADGAYAADDRFHAVFVQASANAEIARVLRRLEPRLHRLERRCASRLPGRRAVAQHQAMVARAAAGDAGGAASAARENWMTLGAQIDQSLAPPAERLV